MTLARFTEPGLLVPRLLSKWRESAIIELSQRLATTARIENEHAFTHAVMDHESQVATTFDGIAFSLARDSTAKELSFALGLSQQGIRWGIGRTRLVHTVALFAVPHSEGQRYISLILSFSRFLKDEMAFSQLRGCGYPEGMLDVLSKAQIVRTGPASGVWQ